MRRKISDPAVASNFCLIVPIAVLLSQSRFLCAGVVASVLLVSTLHHLSKEKEWRASDGIFAGLLIVFNLFAFYQTGLARLNFFFALLFAVFGYYFFKKTTNYSTNHGVWRLVSVVITLLAVMSQH